MAQPGGGRRTDVSSAQPSIHPPLPPTEAVEAERAVIEEVADVARLGGHGAEGVGAAGGEGVHAHEQHVDQQRPGVAVRQEVQGGAQHGETPQEVPANSPTVVRLPASPGNQSLGSSR